MDIDGTSDVDSLEVLSQIEIEPRFENFKGLGSIIENGGRPSKGPDSISREKGRRYL
jgi:hypothetical protein